MARLRHTVVLTPVPRAWFDSAVATGWDALAEHLGSSQLPLVDGEPLAPGAHYAGDGTVLTIDAWDRHAETAGRVTVTEDDNTTTCHVRFQSAAAPRALQLEGGVGNGRRLGTATGDLTADFERWWACRGPAVQGRFQHAAVRGSVTIGLERGDRWRVEVAVTVRGRGLYLPLVGPVLLFGRARFRREFVKALNKFAVRWDDEVPKFLAMSPEQLRELITAEVAKT